MAFSPQINVTPNTSESIALTANVVTPNATSAAPTTASVVTVSADGNTELWNLTADQSEPTELAASSLLSGKPSNELSVALSPDGKMVLIGHADGMASLWDTSNGSATVRSLNGHKGGVNTVEFSTSGKYAVTGGDDGLAIVWDVASGKALNLLSGHKDRVFSAAWSSDDGYVLTGSADTTALLWRLSRVK